MNKDNKKDEKVFTFLIIVSGATILGLGVGFAFLATSSLYFVSSILVGLGLGILGATYIINRSK